MLAAAGAAIGFGASYPMTAVAIRAWSPLGSAAIQGTLALVLVAALAALSVLPRPSRAIISGPAMRRLCVLGLLGGTGFIAGMNLAVALAGPAIAGFVATLYAVAAALLAVPILGERLRAGTVGAFLLALAGTLLLAGAPAGDASPGGVAAGLVAALCFGLYLVLSRRWSGSHRLDGTSITLANLVGRGPVMLVAVVATDPAGAFPGEVGTDAALAMLGLVVIPSMLSQLLILASVRRIPARRTGALLLLAPLTAAAISVVALGEPLSTAELAGGALVVLGIAGASGAVELAAGWIRTARRGPDAGTR